MFGALSYTAPDEQNSALPWLITGQIQKISLYLLSKQEETEKAKKYLTLWTYDLCGPVRYAFDAGNSITRASACIKSITYRPVSIRGP